MKYLCLCYYDERKFEAMSKADLEALERECPPHDEALRASGQLILVGSLALPQSSAVIRPGNGDPRVTHGAYARTGEPLGAFFVVEAADLDEAVRIASKHPGARLSQFGGGIEVRPCDLFELTPSGRG